MQHDIPINGVAPESRFDLYAELKRLCATWSAVSGDETASVDDRSHAFAAVALLAADEVLTR